MDNDNNMTRDQLINLLEINEKRVNHVHEALWEEEKHYTWISYILAGGLISVFLLIVQNIDKIKYVFSYHFFHRSHFTRFIGNNRLLYRIQSD
jgi:hypothetical protein